MSLIKVAEEASGRGKCQACSEQFSKGEWKLGLTSHSATKWVKLETVPRVLQPVLTVLKDFNLSSIAELGKLPEEARESLVAQLSASPGTSVSPNETVSEEAQPGLGSSSKSKGKVSWKFGGRSFEGELIPSKETATHCFARTHKGNIKTLAKGKAYWHCI